MSSNLERYTTVTLRNYRCFDWKNPATLLFGHGFTAYVGANNSGKSSALRAVFELRNCWPAFFQTLQLGHQFQAAMVWHGISDPNELANDNDPGRFEVTIKLGDIAQAKLGQPRTAISCTLNFDVVRGLMSTQQIVTIDEAGNVDTLSSAELRNITGQNDQCVSYAKYGQFVDYSDLQAFLMELHHSRYFPAFRNAINEGAGMYYDLPVGTALVNAWDFWKAGTVRSQKIAIARVERQIAELLGFRSLQINADQSAKTLDVIIDDRPHKLYEIGAGVAQLIIVFAAALVQRPSYILIDEPELSLHPALQLSFLSTLSSYASRGVLFSTHSFGLARCAAEHIFTVQRVESGRSTMAVYGDRRVNLAEWLGELGYANRTDLGCEGVLLVEGPTEVLCFQELLRKLGKDAKYAILQLGGSSLINAHIAIHLEELKRLVEPAKIRVFIDSEKPSPDAQLSSDRQAFRDQCGAMGVHVQVSDRRATENYFESDAIKATLGEEYSPLDAYQILKDSPKPWKKSDNWKIARATDFEVIRNTDLGQFLLSL